MYGVADLGKLTGISAYTVRLWFRNNEFPNAVRVGGRWLAPESDVKNFIEKGRNK
jgi:excisionase family DNA binding protein